MLAVAHGAPAVFEPKNDLAIDSMWWFWSTEAGLAMQSGYGCKEAES